MTFIKKYLVLLILILLYAASFSYLSILRHAAFASGYDLSNMDQVIWNTLHGRFFELTGIHGTISRFSIHADIFLIFLSPLYFFWDSVESILIFQSLLLALGAIPVFFLSQKITKSTVIAYFMVLVYLLNPGMEWANIYDFHSVVFAIPFLLSSFYFAVVKKWKWYFLFIFLALVTKEEIGLTVAMMGIFIAIFFKKYRIGFVTACLGGVWTFVMVHFFISYFNPEHTYSFFSWYRFVDADVSTSAISQIPATVFNKYFSTPDDIRYYVILLKEYAFLPLVGIPWIFLSAPEVVINVLSDHAQMRSILFQYDSGVIPGLMISTIYAVSYIKVLLQKIVWTNRFNFPILFLLMCSVVLLVTRVNYGYGPLPINPSCWCVSYKPTADDISFARVLATIPSSASITASPEIRPHLTHRENAYTLPSASSSADFIALIDQNRIFGNYGPKVYELTLLKQLQKSTTYVLVKHIHHFYLYESVKYKAYKE